jgi:hypothetical protein
MEDVDLPNNVLEGANYVRLDLLPEKYKILYEKEYSLLLCQWRLSNEYFPLHFGQNILCLELVWC